MPRIFLSPSTQGNNLYVSGGSEKYYMNLLADAMIPYLVSSGIRYTRNDSEKNAVSAINDSNKSAYDLHLALHSNAAPAGQYGQYRGIIVYYYMNSANSKRGAQIFAKNLKNIYPLPDKVKTEPTMIIGEVTRTKAPSVFLELGYHDNYDDAQWVKDNISTIARNLVYSLTEYFNIPFVYPISPIKGIVTTNSTNLNLRQKPSTSANIIGKIPKGASVTVNGIWQQWYVINYNGNVGYAHSEYIRT